MSIKGEKIASLQFDDFLNNFRKVEKIRESLFTFQLSISLYDGGFTLDELHADICQDFIVSVGTSDADEYNFAMFDSNSDGVVTLKEFLDMADTLINM